MNTPLENTDQLQGQVEQAERHHIEKYLHETDQAAVEELGARYRERVPAERIEAMKELPTSIEDREAFDNTYIHEAGQAPEPGTRILGYSRGTIEHAHVAIDHLEVPKTIYHERLHQMSAPGIEKEIGSRLDEGITEDLAIDNLGAEPVQGGLETYPTERAVAHDVREMCGNDAVEKAYFQGDTRELRACLDKNLGQDGLRRLRESLDDWPELEEQHV